jgi:hypothetical protein
MTHNHLESYFAACQLLGTYIECNGVRKNLYAGRMDAYDIKFEKSVFQPSLFGGLHALTLVVLRDKS